MIADDLANAVLELERAWMAKASGAQLDEHIGHCARLARRAIAEPAVDKSPVLQGAPVDKAANLQGRADGDSTKQALNAHQRAALAMLEADPRREIYEGGNSKGIRTNRFYISHRGGETFKSLNRDDMQRLLDGDFIEDKYLDIAGCFCLKGCGEKRPSDGARKAVKGTTCTKTQS